MTQKFLRDDGVFSPLASSGSSSSGPPTLLTNSTTATIAISAAVYTDGPSVSQGSSGIWLAIGTITVANGATAGSVNVKLWDGTTVIASGEATTSPAAGEIGTLSLSGVISSPAGNIKMSAFGLQANNVMQFNASGNSKDSTLTVIRIG